MDWDKLRIFHAVAEAGSFTHAGEALGLSQSAASRQVSALERDLNLPLFHRHARGLLLTEQGELLYRTTREMSERLDQVHARLTDTKEAARGLLRVTTTSAFGAGWLVPRLAEFAERYPEIEIHLLLEDGEVDLAMRQADVGVRLRVPRQLDVIRRPLFPVSFDLYASAGYLEAYGRPATLADLCQHRLVAYRELTPKDDSEINWHTVAGLEKGRRRPVAFRVNSFTAIIEALKSGLGVGAVPAYMRTPDDGLERVLPDADSYRTTAYFVYSEELRDTKRVLVFRDFLLEKVRETGLASTEAA